MDSQLRDEGTSPLRIHLSVVVRGARIAGGVHSSAGQLDAGGNWAVEWHDTSILRPLLDSAKATVPRPRTPQLRETSVLPSPHAPQDGNSDAMLLLELVDACKARKAGFVRTKDAGATRPRHTSYIPHFSALQVRAGGAQAARE